MTNDLVFLSRDDIASLGIVYPEVLALVENAYRMKADGRGVSLPKREVSPRPGATIRSMVASIPGSDAVGIKWMSGYPQNCDIGLPTLSGLMVLNDTRTGFPSAVMEATWITTMRTGCSAAVAARLLANPDSHRVGIVACGAQGRSSLEALCHAFRVDTVKAFDVHPSHALRFAEEMSHALGVMVYPVDSAREAARDVDILVTSTPISRDPCPPIDADDLSAGTFACLLDYDAALSPRALYAMDAIMTDDLPQFRQCCADGYFRETPEPETDLGLILSHGIGERASPQQRIACINMGIGILDLALAQLALSKARQQQVGLQLPLWNSTSHTKPEIAASLLRSLPTAN